MSETTGLAPRQAQTSITTMTEYVLPTHANALGNVFGGQILAWVDLCAAICAQRHTGRMAITAAIDELSFEKPIRVGQVVHLCAQITATFRTSVEILVEVSGEEATTGHKWPCVTAYVTYVALDENLLPTSVPPLELTTDEQRARSLEAHERRAHRLAKRNRRP